MNCLEGSAISTGDLEDNVDVQTALGFGDEWSRFPQDRLTPEIREKVFLDYFSLFDWSRLPVDAIGADIGCGSGRWAQLVAPKVGHLILIDVSSQALEVAKANLRDNPNVSFHNASVGSLPIDNDSLDFAYCLGVIHHVPDTAAAIKSIAAKLKKGAPFLVYLYYRFDNRSWVYRTLWKLSDIVRYLVSRLPHGLRYIISQVIAVFVYWPLSRMAGLMERLGVCPNEWPLAYYRDKPFYMLRTDALDRFGTRLEKRFTQEEIRSMMTCAGFVDIQFSDHAPYWCAVGIKG